jgi:hypothetical protein
MVNYLNLDLNKDDIYYIKANQIKEISTRTMTYSKNGPEHAVEMFRLLSHARLSILPGIHGAYIGEATTGMEHSSIPDLAISMIEKFLNEPMPKKN